ncbi:DUF6531 domain-containing protein [Streptomyces sp. KN37]|uniref:DUF6531 domain-containing protein n=1 Tax=Streptomyces sp. KN37 TaxID=3090667 RepID=UPI002A75A0DA|nr:DUF6531 domain-containing protein [Streptomyces sp. KN37]WPO72127.1 RHS repeat-associated core domain-containing protein [Streptomyces sp. KN37]
MGGHRPRDWHVLDLEKDPTPGDPDRVRKLAKDLHDFSDDVGKVLRDIKGMAGEDAILRWAGKTADAFTEKFEKAPEKLKKLKKSYGMAGDALAAYWPELERAQALADKALVKGREAQADLSSAKSRISSAESWVEKAGKEADKYKDKGGSQGKDVPKPDEDKVRAATRNAASAEKAQKSAQGDVDAAKSALEAAKKMAADARKMREEAAGTAKRKIDEASDAGIRNRKWWEEIGDWVSDNWDTIVEICKVVVAVVGIIAMIVGGPILAAIVIVAGAIVLADTLSKYAKGQATLMDVAFSALDCIPGAKGITTAAKLAKGAKGGLKAMAKGLGKGGLRRGADDAAGAGKKAASRCKNGDPIDMVSGEMLMEETDVDLPGLMPLVLRRTHLSTYGWGRWFGPSWASTLDERLELDAEGVVFAAEDGMILLYPVPRPGASVMPLEGPRWPLDWDGSPGAPIRISDPQAGTVRHFASLGAPGPDDTAFVMPLAAISDSTGRRVEFDRDAIGTPTAVRDSAGRHLRVDTDGGRVTRLRLDDAEAGPEGVTLLSYGYSDDGRGNLTEVRDSGGALKLTYDGRNRITSWTDRNGGWYRFTYDDLDRCVRGEGTDGRLSCTVAYDTENRETRYTDSLGRTTTYRHNELRQLMSETNPLGQTTYLEWDRYDRLLSRTDPLGRTTRYRYDEHGFPTHVLRPDGGQSVAELDERGRPVTVTEPDGAVWRMEYDSAGRLTAETDPTGTRLSFGYDEAGGISTITDATGRATRVETDAAGLPVATTDAEGATTRYERDAFGRLVAQTGPDGSRTAYTWTPEGRLALRTLPDGSTERRAYDGEGNLVEYVDSLGRVTRFEYGAFDLLEKRTEPDGSCLRFTYDGELRVTSVTNQLGATWSYTYDDAGRLIQERDFEGRTRSYRHDAAGQLIGQTNGAGETTEYVRDLLGKVLEQRTPEGVTSYEYDPVGNLRVVRSEHAEVAYERDALGRILAETCNGATVRSAYDELGRRTRRVTPSNAESLWEYDGRDRPVLLRTAGRAVSFGYDDAGREIERRAGAMVLTQGWDPDSRLSSQAVTADASPTRPERRRVQERTYRYRSDGTIHTIDDLVNGRRTIDVDPTGRVTAVRADTWSERYAYDAAGNVASAERQGAAAAAASGGVSGGSGRPGGVRYVFDAQGRVVRRRRKRLSRKADVWHYTWDSQDRLVGVVTPDGTKWAYLYDPFGRRIAKRRFAADGETVVEEVWFVWDGFVLAEQVRRSGDEPLRCTTWDWERDRFSPVTQVERVAGFRAHQDAEQEWIDEEFYSIVTDVVGTPTELCDAEGELAWCSRTTVWGAPVDEEASGDRAYCPLRFPGQYHDPESGLHYNYQRHYDPETGQYVSLDPLDLAPGPNPRAYAANPFTGVDPLGLAPDCERALQAARDRADLEQGRPGASKQTRPTSAAGLTVPGHPQTYSGASIKGGGDHNLHPDVQAAYDRVPMELRPTGNQHGRCGEAEALSNAMNSGHDPRGGVSAAVDVRAAGNPKHGVPKAPCSSCQHVLDQFGITAVT